MLKYVCACCVRFVLIYSIVVNLALACSCLSPMLNLVCYVWLYYSWFFMFNCTVLSCSVTACNNSCGFSTVWEIMALLLLFLTLGRYIPEGV